MSQNTRLDRWAGALVFSIALSGVGCSSDRGTPPDHLVGIWRTAVSQYSDSTMELMKDSIVFKGGDGSSVRGRITQFEQIQEGSTIFYRLSYRDAGKNEYHLNFAYDPANGGTVTFKNQPALVWKRTGGVT